MLIPASYSLNYCQSGKITVIYNFFPTVYDYVTVPTNATCGPLAFGEETLPPPSEDPMVTTNTAFAVSMEEGIVAPNSEETPPL